jgi:hypothetical protein
MVSSDFHHVDNFDQKDDALYQALLADARFHELLLVCDRDLAAAARARRCARCGGRLDAAPFARKPRGRAACGEATDNRRFSFCCAVDGCRKRVTPPSLRFLHRKVYLGAVVVLIGAMQHGLTESRLCRLQAVVGVSRRTVARWRAWWLEVFAASPFWTQARAGFMPPADPSRLPASMLERFAGTAEERLLGLLRFLAPITGGAGTGTPVHA